MFIENLVTVTSDQMSSLDLVNMKKGSDGIGNLC